MSSTRTTGCMQMRACVTLLLGAIGLSGAASYSTHAADSDMNSVLRALAALQPKSIETLTPEQARRQPTVADAALKVLQDEGKSTQPPPLADVAMMEIPTPAGPLSAKLYTPPGDGPMPVVVYFHGGGWVLADANTYDLSARHLALGAGAIVVSVNYRQAPENPFPAAADDAFQAFQWVSENAATFGGDPRRVAVAGESAGGNLATVATMMSRDRNARMPVHQLLVYPITNDDLGTPSYKRYADAKPLNKPMMKWFFDRYLPSRKDRANPYAFPLKGKLGSLPPATIIVAELDPLADDGRQYAKKLEAAGVPVTLNEYKGVTHEFFGLVPVVDDAASAMKVASSALKDAFADVATR